MNRNSHLTNGTYRSPIGVDVKICWQALIPADLERIDRALLALGTKELARIAFQDGRRFVEARETPNGVQFLYQTLNTTAHSPEEAQC